MAEGENIMIMGIPAITFIGFAVQPVIIVLAIIYAINYDKLVKKAPFDYYQKLEDAVKDKD